MSLGPPINRPEKPKPDETHWTPVPGKPHLLRNERGQLRTNLPEPLSGKAPVPTT